MAVGSHVPAHAEDGASVLDGQKGAGVILRPIMRPEMSPDASGSFSGPPSQLSGRGSAEEAAAGFSFPARRYGEPALGAREQVYLEDGLGAMRGLMLIVGLYMVMGMMGVGGLLIWHWMH